MNSCTKGFIQYKPTNNITDKFKKTSADPNNKDWLLEDTSPSVSCNKVEKFSFILNINTRLSYLKTNENETLKGQRIGSF